jgi:hypothetical protein
MATTANNDNVPVNVNTETGAETGSGGQVLATDTNEIIVPASDRLRVALPVADTQSYGEAPDLTPPLSSLSDNPADQDFRIIAQPALSFAGINVPPPQEGRVFPPPEVNVGVSNIPGIQVDVGGLPLAPQQFEPEQLNTGANTIAGLPEVLDQPIVPFANTNVPVDNTSGYSLPGISPVVDLSARFNEPVDPQQDPFIVTPEVAQQDVLNRAPAPVPDAALDQRILNQVLTAPGNINRAPGNVATDLLAGVVGAALPVLGLTGESNNFNTLVNAARNAAISQPSIDAQRRQPNTRDWRVRLSLAPNAAYLYNTASSGDLLFPLRLTNGIIFPYTPQITTNYQTNYNKTPLTHSNYQGLFYQNSQISNISMQATFTAQDTLEANYLLACIHFLRTVGKMFYGQDNFAGAPPPLLYLSGFGEFQFNNHTCLLESFTYTLPADVDYIRARSTNQVGLDLLQRRNRQSATPYNSLNSVVSRLQQLYEITTGLFNRVGPGANPKTQTSPNTGRAFEIGGDNPTYVPTKMDISLTLLPVNTRTQVSKQFSVNEFGKGNLLRGGFW